MCSRHRALGSRKEVPRYDGTEKLPLNCPKLPLASRS
jgi:hypothetical protein